MLKELCLNRLELSVKKMAPIPYEVNKNDYSHVAAFVKNSESFIQFKIMGLEQRFFKDSEQKERLVLSINRNRLK